MNLIEIDFKVIDIIMDLEATCWEDDIHKENDMETIEIGAVALDLAGKISDEFTTFIKPTHNPIISDFCTKLTTITQEDVNSGLSFKDGLAKFHAWLTKQCGSYNTYRLWSWGYYDRAQLERDCQYHDLDCSWLDGIHYNLKTAFALRRSDRREMGTKRAIKASKLKWQGTHHRGIDDAKNIAQIFNLHRDWYIANVKPTVQR